MVRAYVRFSEGDDMLRVKDWSSFQSYKDRKPPWIRLHKTLLDNYEFHSLSINARAILPMLWLLASEDYDPVSGLLRDGYEKIAFRLRVTKKELEGAISECIKAGFLEEIKETNQEVTEPLRIEYETVTPETETETDKKENGKPKKKNHEDLSLEDISTWLAEKRAQGIYVEIDEVRLLEKFKNYCRAKNPKYTDYIAALRNSFEWKDVPKRGGNNESTSSIHGKPKGNDWVQEAKTRALRDLGVENPSR